FENVEARPAGHMDIENNAGRCARPRRRQEGATISKGGDLITLQRQDHRQGVAHRLVVVDNEDLTLGLDSLGHYPLMWFPLRTWTAAGLMSAAAGNGNCSLKQAPCPFPPGSTLRSPPWFCAIVREM